MIVTIPERALFPCTQVNASLVLLKFCGALRCSFKKKEKRKKKPFIHQELQKET